MFDVRSARSYSYYSGSLCGHDPAGFYCSTTDMVAAGYPIADSTFGISGGSGPKVFRMHGIWVTHAGGGAAWPGAVFCVRIVRVRNAVSEEVLPNELDTDSDDVDAAPLPGQRVIGETPTSTPDGSRRLSRRPGHSRRDL